MVSGAAEGLINVVAKSNSENKILLLKYLNRLDINSITVYNEHSFESKVIKMANEVDFTHEVKGKTFIDNTAITDIQYNNEFKVEYNKNFISFYLSDLTEYDAPDLNHIKRNFSCSTYGFFDATDYPLKEIVDKLNLYEELINSEQVGFLITQEQYPYETKIEHIDKTELLDYLCNNDFEKLYKTFERFNVWIIVDELEFILNEEMPENWLLDWYNHSEEKKTWLKKNRIRFDPCDAIQLRKSFTQKWDERDIKEETIYSQRANNTLRWIKKNENIEANQYGTININKFIEEYTINHKKLPDYLMTVNLETNVHELARANKLELGSSIWQQNFTNDHFLKSKDSVIEKTGAEAWIDFSYITQKLSIKLIIDIAEKVEIKDVVDTARLPDLLDKEWSENFYKTWKVEYAKDYTIYLLVELVNKKLDVECGDDKWSISGATSECEYQKDGSKYYIYLKRDSNKVPIQVLEANYNKVFPNNHDLFVKLQKCYIDQILDPAVIEKHDLIKDYTKGQLIDIITKVRDGKTGDLNAPDWNDEEKAKFEELREKLKKLMNDEEAEEKLDEMLKDKDPKINSISGYIGERLLYYWLNYKYPGLVNHINEPEYDLLLDYNNIQFHIEVKTTVGSIEEDGNSVPVYLRKSQRKFIADNKSDNYFLIMIGLDDVGLKSSFYSKYKGKELTEDRKNEIDIYLSKWINDRSNYQEVSNQHYHLRLTTKQNLTDPFIF